MGDKKRKRAAAAAQGNITSLTAIRTQRAGAESPGAPVDEEQPVPTPETPAPALAPPRVPELADYLAEKTAIRRIISVEGDPGPNGEITIAPTRWWNFPGGAYEAVIFSAMQTLQLANEAYSRYVKTIEEITTKYNALEAECLAVKERLEGYEDRERITADEAETSLPVMDTIITGTAREIEE